MAQRKKSDYYHYLDRRTLTKQLHNPWRNNMKRGIVASPYSGTDTTAYYYGPSFYAAYGAPPATLYNWTNDDQGIGNSDGAHHFAGNRWDVTPGVRSITELKVMGGYLRTDNAYSYAIEVWRDDTTVYTLVASSGAITPVSGSTGNEYTTVTPASPVSVTIESGQTYYVGLRVIRKSASSATPYFYGTTDLTFGYNHLRFAVKATSWNGTTVTKADVANESYTYNANATAIIMRIAYTSGNYLEQDRANPTAASWLTPYVPTDRHVVKLEGVVVADTKSITALAQDISGTGTNTTHSTTKMDMGEAVGGTNTMTYFAANVNLPDIHTEVPTHADMGQEGCKFDFIWGYRLNDAYREDFYWQNRTLEACIHAHSVAVAATRGTLQSYSAGRPAILTLSGTFTIAKLRVGVKPIILVGDSQCITGYEGYERSPNANNWGGMPTEFTKERIWIMHGQAGMAMSELQGFFKHATPGSGDGVELSGTYTLRGTWFFAGLGVNDISLLSTASDKDSKQAVAQIMADFTTTLEDLTNYGDEIVIAGLPPYSDDSPEADQYENRAVRLLNRAYLGLALALECVYYNPWPDTVTPGTEDDTEPTFAAAYTSDGGTHYSAAGGTLVRAKLKDVYEYGGIDLRDAWD